ncbi:MAG: hypothetical protein ACKVOQ_06255 [Cyclobacteriaceae bacterium]
MPFTEGSIYFNKISVLQSLDEIDRKTGTELYEDILSKMKFKDPKLGTEITNVYSSSDLFHHLNKIEAESRKGNVLPLIHFETHGTHTGLALSSGDIIDWLDLIKPIARINANCNNNLFVSVAACWGGQIQFQVKVTEPCPFRGFIGPMESINPSDIISSFVPFFEELLNTNNFELAIENLNALNENGILFHHMNSEAFFDVVVNNYVRAFSVTATESEMAYKMKLVDEVWCLPDTKSKFRSRKALERFLDNRSERLIHYLIEMRGRFLHQN